MRNLPNALSCIRVPLSLLLLLTIDNKILFLSLYMMCGLSDLADGVIARKMNCVTAVGAKLDSVADIVFSMVSIYLIFSQTNLISSLYLSICVLLVSGLRIVNILIVKVKFRQWNVTHTISNKVTGLALFLILPIYFTWGSVPTAIVVICTALAFISSIEETCILVLSNYYNVNRRSLLSYVDGKVFIRCTEHILNKN